MNTKAVTAWMALLALTGVVVAPPEVFGSGRALLVIASTAVFLVAAFEGQISSRYLLGGLIGGSLLLAHSLLVSVDTYRSVEFLTLGWAYYCLFGFFSSSPIDLRRRTALTLVLMAGAVSVYGIHQYFWGLEDAYDYAVRSGLAAGLQGSVASRLESGRVFSTFALPGTLWGFLVLTLPLHAMLREPGRSTRNWALVLNAALVLAATSLTRSYGFVLGLLVIVIGWHYTRPNRPDGPRDRRRAALAAALLVGAVPVLYLARGVQYNAVSLRLQNWLSAWEIFAAHPWGGGLNTYGILYALHQQPGANETQFAHNTPFQLLAELGLIGLVAGALVAGWLLGRPPRARSLDGAQRCLLLAVLVWTVHNLMDIDLYFGSVGAVGIVLIALLAWRPAPVSTPGGLQRRLAQCAGLTGILVIGASGIMYVSGELLYRAEGERDTGDVPAAVETLALAETINPFDSDIQESAGLAALELYHRQDDPLWLDRAGTHFSTASALSPLKVGPHIGTALCLASRDETGEALRSLEIAQTLHPGDAQLSAIRRLIEQRHGILAVERGTDALDRTVQ